MSIKQLTKKILQFRDERDWKQFHTPKELAAAITIEAGELLEHFLWKSSTEIEGAPRGKKELIREEIADVAICLFELAEVLGVDEARLSATEKLILPCPRSVKSNFLSILYYRINAHR